MDPIASILLAVDRNAAAAQALQKAIALTRHFGAQLELFLCDAELAYQLAHEFDPRGVEEARTCCLAKSRRYLESLRDAAGASDMDIAIDVACESPLYEGIVRKVRQTHADLLIRCTGTNGSNGRAPSPTDWELIRTAPVPLLLIRSRLWKRPLRIAAAVDISSEETPQLSRTILKNAQYLISGREGAIEVLYGGRNGAALESQRAALSQCAEEAEARVEHIHVLHGDPAETLPQFAAGRHFDVLVLGALTHHEAATALVGTLTARLIDSLKCDFLLVKPESYVCPVPSWRAEGLGRTQRK